MTEPVVAEPSNKRRSRIPFVVGVAVLVAAVLAGGWWATHPTRLGPVGDVVGVPGTVGQPVLVGLFIYPQNGSVVLRDATPRVASGSAAARVRVLWCVGPEGGTPVGTARGTARQTCAETPGLAGQRLTMPTPENNFAHLVVEVIPLEAGDVRVDGADVAYSAGLRRGSQASGVVVKVEAAGLRAIGPGSVHDVPRSAVVAGVRTDAT